MSVELPSRLLAAVASNVGSRLTLVIGAGCSLEPPTDLPLSKALALQAHSELVADGVIGRDACAKPWDLSALTEAVLAATGKQEAVVKALPLSHLKSAAPNRGYCKAAALLRERVIGDLITLNFDLAQSTAVADICGREIAIIDGPESHHGLGHTNVIYLHRNVNCQDLEAWILTQESMSKAWEEGAWEAVVVRRSAAAPVVLFAGLGSPAAVLEHSVREIRKVVRNEIYLADPDDVSESPFFAALEIEMDRVIPLGWVDLMDALAERLAVKQRQVMLEACRLREAQEGWGIEAWAAVHELLEQLDLLELGSLRANWTLRLCRYWPATDEIAEQLSELLAVVELLVQAKQLRPELQSNGALAFFGNDGRLRAVVAFVSGRGARSGAAIEAEITKHQKYVDGRPTPTTYVVTGVTGALSEVSAPDDIATGQSEDELVGGWREYSIILAHEIFRTRELDGLIA